MEAAPLSERLLEPERYVVGAEDFAPASRPLSRSGAWLTNGHWIVHLPTAPRSLQDLAAGRRQSAVSPSALTPALAAGERALAEPPLRLAGLLRACSCGGEPLAVLERTGRRRGAVQVAAQYASYLLRAGLTLHGTVQGEPVAAARGRQIVAVVGSLLPSGKGYEPVSLADLEQARARRQPEPRAQHELGGVPKAAASWAAEVLPTLQLEHHELREPWLAAAVAQFRHWFAALGAPLPDELRVACSWPKDRRSTSVIGQCAYGPGWRDGIDQLTVSPALEDPSRVLDVLLHELVHAACGMTCAHGKGFRRLALACGLSGQMTATSASPELAAVLEQLVARHLGPYPHAAPKGWSPGGEPAPRGTPPAPGWPKPQASRMRLYECERCGQKLRAATDELEAVHVPDRGHFRLRSGRQAG